MNKKILFGILAGIVVIIAAVYVFTVSTVQNSVADASAVKGVVMEFGEKMKNVSLQSPKEIVEKDIKENYSGLVTDELLASWIADFSLMPGKVASSPWPTGIRIQDIKKIDGDKYKVLGKVIEVTSVEEIQGGAASEYNVEMIVEKRDGEWLIAEYKNLNLSETANWQIYKNDLADFTFKYPMEWDIREDYLYESSGGTKAEHRAIVLCDKKNEKNSSGDYSMKDCIQINMPQAPENEQTKKIGDNYLNLYSDNPEIIKIYEKVADSFQIIDESADAEQVLLAFFGYLKNKEYDKAVGLLEIPENAIQEIPENAIQECSMDEDDFDGCPNETWNGLKTFSPQEDENSKRRC
ncbi:hypothetical protein A2Y83_03745 [Candidatus Falkowbacteria bacterium RBG_13_39_14]|uniref:Uncharacterized protein n=1 Tax=Candidatus Falkowbacteria bacterium RBG_13_39_14 TaxID=1797985 RepID=A0A1F5S1R2_9BACT|nr:MAG: hypothetical protein A2Y83_03745 [Candidatus Falkowbacteria bacterium RBG_13_39_14]